jgi:hypothetical protein
MLPSLFRNVQLTQNVRLNRVFSVLSTVLIDVPVDVSLLNLFNKNNYDISQLDVMSE